MLRVVDGGGADPRRCRFQLTFVLERRDDQLEPIGLCAPAVGHVLQGHEVSPRVNVAHRLFRVATRQVGLQANNQHTQ